MSEESIFGDQKEYLEKKGVVSRLELECKELEARLKLRELKAQLGESDKYSHLIAKAPEISDFFLMELEAGHWKRDSEMLKKIVAASEEWDQDAIRSLSMICALIKEYRNNR